MGKITIEFGPGEMDVKVVYNDIQYINPAKLRQVEHLLMRGFKVEIAKAGHDAQQKLHNERIKDDKKAEVEATRKRRRYASMKTKVA